MTMPAATRPTSFIDLRGRVAAAALLPLILAAGCAFPDAPLAGHAGIRPQIEAYYAAHAMEANATCPNPRIDAINDAQVVENTPATVVLLVRYRWLDDNVTTDLGDGGSLLNCWAWGERRFTFDRTGDVLTLRSMSGLQRSMENR